MDLHFSYRMIFLAAVEIHQSAHIRYPFCCCSFGMSLVDMARTVCFYTVLNSHGKFAPLCVRVFLEIFFLCKITLWASQQLKLQQAKEVRFFYYQLVLAHWDRKRSNSGLSIKGCLDNIEDFKFCIFFVFFQVRKDRRKLSVHVLVYHVLLVLHFGIDTF